MSGIEKIFTIICVFFIILMIMTFKVEQKEYFNNYSHVGDNVIINEDTLVIIDYKYREDVFILNNDIKITSKSIKMFELIIK
jgi:hypothetical protein